MRVQREAWCSILLAVLVGCGGSGSSGFDPFVEGRLIQQALDEQRCVRGDDTLTICPSGATVRDPSGGLPSPSDIRVSASVARADFVDCSGSGEVAACSVTVEVEVEGLEPGAQVRIATRLVPDGQHWSVGAPLAVAASDEGPAMLAPVTVGLAGDANATGSAEGVQVAVLVFGSAPVAIAGEVEELGETGASYAFVLAPVPVTPPPAP